MTKAPPPGKAPSIGTCALCLQEAPLCRSHIVPEFLYAHLYNDKRQIMGVHCRGNDGYDLIQKGLRDRLLCAQCESFINLNYEIPFRQAWVDNPAIPRSGWAFNDVKHVRMPYAPFKLFHLSVMYRAALAKHRTYKEADLSEDDIIRLREMLLAGNPGPPSRYGIAGLALVHHRSGDLVDMISRPTIIADSRRQFFQMMYGCVEWTIKLTRASHSVFDRQALDASGRMPIRGVDWRTLPTVQLAGAGLRGEVTF